MQTQTIVIIVVAILLLIGVGVGGYLIYEKIQADRVVEETNKDVEDVISSALPTTLKNYAVVDISNIPNVAARDTVPISQFVTKCKADKGVITIAHDSKKISTFRYALKTANFTCWSESQAQGQKLKGSQKTIWKRNYKKRPNTGKERIIFSINSF